MTWGISFDEISVSLDCKWPNRIMAPNEQELWLPTWNSTTLGFRRYKQSRDLCVVYYVMALQMLTIGNSQCLSTKFFQNVLQTCKSLNKLISLLIFNFVEKKNRSGPIITQNSNKNENKIKLLDDPLKGKKLF